MYPMPDGSWRLLGVLNSTGPRNLNLDGTTQKIRNHVFANSTPRWLHWLETQTGRDITPCHNWNGNGWDWAGNSHCGYEYDTAPGSSSSAWPSCSSSTLPISRECAGWFPPGPTDITTGVSEADALLDFLVHGGGAPPRGEWLGGRLKMMQLVGTTRDDRLSHPGADTRLPFEAFGGRGHDSIFGELGPDELHGGVGDDLLVGGRGDDVLVPGHGLDFVYGGDGNDTIIISGTCELERGEVIDGGAGFDVLHSPVGAAELAKRGVSVLRIERIVINHPDVQRATCETLNEYRHPEAPR